MAMYARSLRCSVHGRPGYMLGAWHVSRMLGAWHVSRRSQYADMVHDAVIYALCLMLLVSMLEACRPLACYALGIMLLGCHALCIWNAAPLSKGWSEVKGWYGTIARTDGAWKLGSWYLVLRPMAYHLVVPGL